MTDPKATSAAASAHQQAVRRGTFSITATGIAMTRFQILPGKDTLENTEDKE